MKSAFDFKVTSKGVMINLNPEVEYETVREELKEHVREASEFFAGVDIYLNVSGNSFSDQHLTEIIDIINGYEKVKEVFITAEAQKGNSSNKPGRDTILIKGTVRSGQRIKYPTNIVVVGDINPGAEVIAAGDIVVLGKLRGVVHAGAGGFSRAEVIALRLQPTQIRIADYISRAPDKSEVGFQTDKPEKAFIRQNAIVIEDLNI